MIITKKRFKTYFDVVQLKAMSFLFQEVHKEVPYQTERRVCPGDADWDDVRDTVGGSFSPSVIADAFNQVINTYQ